MKINLNNKLQSIFLIVFILLLSLKSHAWGKRGHETVGSLAAQLLAEKHKGSEFLKNHSFDMGYYNNVPDIVWKSDPETYKKEFFQHFVDMEEFRSVKEWSSNKGEFFKKHPNIKETAGRSFWRIQGLNDELQSITSKLMPSQNLESLKNVKTSEDKIKQQHQNQSLWLLYAGVMGHYIADLAMPLHVTNNYDGQKTNQKGIHKWFEETLVDELYPEIHMEVFNQAKKQWDVFHKTNKLLTVFELAQQLTKDSQSQIPSMLKIDKKIGRKDIRKASKEYRQLIINRLSLGTLYLAEVWSRQTGWPYSGEKFYLFNSQPAFITP